jgi:hypothetical protein
MIPDRDKFDQIAQNCQLQHTVFKPRSFWEVQVKIRHFIARKITLTDPFGWQISDLLTRTTGW